MGQVGVNIPVITLSINLIVVLIQVDSLVKDKHQQDGSTEEAFRR